MSDYSWKWLENTEFLENSLLRWGIALVLVVVTWLVLRLGLRGLIKHFRRVSSQTETQLDDVVASALERTRWYAYVAVTVFVGSQALRLPAGTEVALQMALVLVLLLQAGVWGSAGIRSGVEIWKQRQESREAATMAVAVSFAARLLMWSLLVVLALANLGIEVTALLAGLGVGGIAAALALQNVLGDLFASLSIYFDRPFYIGEFVIVGDFMGSVENVGLRSTRIRSLSGELLVFSNADLISSRIRNYGQMQERRIAFVIGVTYSTPADKLEAIPGIIREVIESQEGVRFDRSHFRSYGSFCLEFESVYYVLASDYTTYMDRQHAINMQIYRRFETEGIEFAFPTSTVHLRGERDAPVYQVQVSAPRDRS